MNARSPRLAVVPPERREPEPEQALAELVPALLAAEAEVARLRNAVDIQRRRLANERGVAFLRPERVRAEFGGCSRR